MKTTFSVSLMAHFAIALCATASLAEGASFDFEKLQGRPNLQQTPLGSSGQWSLEKLLALTQQEGLELWRAAPPVPLKEMNGHYMGLIPNADDVEAQKRFAATFSERSAHGYWLGKAFRPVTDNTGEGYNRQRFPDGRITHTARMATRIGQSPVDGKPSYVIDYSVFNKGVTTLDELRKLEDFIYLGVATREAGNGQRSEPLFWLLIGPTDRWVGPDPK